MARPIQLRVNASGARQVKGELGKVKGHIGGLEKFAKGAMLAVGVAVAAGIAKIGKAGVDMAMQLDEAQSMVARATGATGETLRAQNAAMRASLMETHHDATAVAGVYGSLATSIGGTADETKRLTDLTLDFATVAGGEPTAVADRLGQAQRIWGLGMEDNIALLDTLTKAGQDNVVPMDKLLKNVIGMGPSLEKLGVGAHGAAFGIAELMQGMGPERVRSMRTGFDYAVAQAARMGRAGDEFFRDYVKRIQEADSEVLKMNLAIEAFGTTAAPVFVEALEQGIDLTRDFAGDAQAAAGQLEFTATTTQTLSERFGELRNKIMVGLGETLMPLLSNLVSFLDNSVIPAINRIQDFGQGLKSAFQEDGWDGVWTYIRDELEDLKDWFFTTDFGKWTKGLLDAFDSEGLPGGVTYIWDWIADEIGNIPVKTAESEEDLESVAQNILNAFRRPGPREASGKDMGVWDWIMDKLDNFEVELNNYWPGIGSSVANGIRTFLVTPDNEWYDPNKAWIWNFLEQRGLEIGMLLDRLFPPEDKEQMVTRFTDMFTWDGFTGGLAIAGGWIWDKLKEVWDGLSDWFDVTFIPTFRQEMLNFVKWITFWDELIVPGAKYVWDEIMRSWNWLKDTFDDLAGSGSWGESVGKILDNFKPGSLASSEFLWNLLPSHLRAMIRWMTNILPDSWVPEEWRRFVNNEDQGPAPEEVNQANVDASDLERPLGAIDPATGGSAAPPSITGNTAPSRPTRVSANPFVPQYQHGGIFTRPSVGMIGEAGPEAVLPLPADWRHGGSMGGTQNITINVSVDNTLGGGVEAGERVVEVLTDFFQRNPGLNMQWAN